jgi:hypothetical protein
MPIVFGVIGLVLIITGVRGTVTGSNPNLVDLVKADLNGKPNYLEWMAVIFVLGALGYIPQLRTLSRLFMALIVIDLFFANKGFFSQFTQEFSAAGNTPQSVQIQSSGLASPVSAASTSSGTTQQAQAANQVSQAAAALNYF